MDAKKLVKLQTIRQKIIVPKTNRNEHNNSFYRNAEEILKALKPLEEATGTVVLIDTSVQKEAEDYVLKSSVELVDMDDGETITGNSFSLVVDLSNRGMSKPQAFGAAASYAKKYALQDMFELDDGKDEDYISAHGIGQAKPAANQAPKIQPAKMNYKPVLADRLRKDGVNADEFCKYGYRCTFNDLPPEKAEEALKNLDKYVDQFIRATGAIPR